MNLKKYNPHADPGKYYLIWYNDIPPNCSTGYVGIILNDANPNIKINIEIDDEWMLNNNYRTVALYVDEDHFEDKSTIVLTSNFFKLMMEEEFLCASLWHEIGHFHTMHYFNTPYFGSSSFEYRMKCFERGLVTKEEQVADLFSVYYSSKEDFLKDIQWLIRTRYSNPYEKEERKIAAVNEMRMRRKLIKDLEESDSIIEKKMCELCDYKGDFSMF